jgi:hypothetical protein
LDFAAVLATADHSFCSLVSLIHSSGDLMGHFDQCAHSHKRSESYDHQVFVSGFLATTSVREWSFLLSSCWMVWIPSFLSSLGKMLYGHTCPLIIFLVLLWKTYCSVITVAIFIMYLYFMKWKDANLLWVWKQFKVQFMSTHMYSKILRRTVGVTCRLS